MIIVRKNKMEATMDRNTTTENCTTMTIKTNADEIKIVNLYDESGGSNNKRLKECYEKF